MRPNNSENCSHGESADAVVAGLQADTSARGRIIPSVTRAAWRKHHSWFITHHAVLYTDLHDAIESPRCVYRAVGICIREGFQMFQNLRNDCDKTAARKLFTNAGALVTCGRL